MATVIRENVGVLNDKLTVKISKDDYYPSFEKAIKDYSKKANIPGFRKGMVPPGMVKKMYGASIFYDEVIKAVEKQIQAYLNEEKPDIFAQPLPLASDLRSLDMNSPADYDFPFEIGIKPEITIADLKNAEVHFYKVNVTDQLINDEVDRLQTRHGKMLAPEKVTTEEDVLSVRFVETDEEGNPVENGITKENSLPVNYFTPSFREQLMGKGQEDSFQLRLQEAFEPKEQEWLISDLGLNEQDPLDLAKSFKMTITKVGLMEKSELDEDLFKKVFPESGIENEEAFRNEIKSGLQKYWDAQSRVQLHDQLYHILVDTPVALPEDFLKKWIQKGGEKEKLPEEVEAEFPAFKDQLKWSLISDKLTQENGLTVTAEELRMSMRNQIMQYFGETATGSDTSWIESYVDTMMKDKKQVEAMHRKLITNKLFEWLQSQVSPVEKETTPEELAGLQHHHQH